MENQEGRIRDRNSSDEQKRCLLKHYLLLLKEYGDMATLLPKSHLYRIAGERAFYSEKTAGKYIREMLSNDREVRDAMKLIDEELA